MRSAAPAAFTSAHAQPRVSGLFPPAASGRGWRPRPEWAARLHLGWVAPRRRCTGLEGEGACSSGPASPACACILCSTAGRSGAAASAGLFSAIRQAAGSRLRENFKLIWKQPWRGVPLKIFTKIEKHPGRSWPRSSVGPPHPRLRLDPGQGTKKNPPTNV